MVIYQVIKVKEVGSILIFVVTGENKIIRGILEKTKSELLRNTRQSDCGVVF
jgi:hypothetical protein